MEIITILQIQKLNEKIEHSEIGYPALVTTAESPLNDSFFDQEDMLSRL